MRMSRVKAEDNNAMKSLQVRVNMRLARGKFFSPQSGFLAVHGPSWRSKFTRDPIQPEDSLNKFIL